MEKILARVFTNKKSEAPAVRTADPISLEAVFGCSQTDNNEDEDLSSWEIVHPSSSDIETYSFHSSSSDVPSLDSASLKQDLIGLYQSFDVKFVSADEPSRYDDYGSGNYDCDFMEDGDDDDDDDDDDNDDDGYDDELVPRGFSDRFGKQRLVKLGKRACNNPKRNNPKKLPCYFYNRAGGVHAAGSGVAWKRKVGRKNEA